jgi:conjugative relaxase-like TrwC/TraI family protein
VLRIHSGHSVDYLTREVAAGRENYYTGAVAEGEPPGRWYGAGAEALGLTGLVDHQDMQALYERFLDPRDERFGDPERWDEVPTLGHAGRKYPTAEELYERSLNAEPYADAERREQLRLNAEKAERHNVAFLDATYSVPKSITVLHAAFEAQEVKARNAGDEEAVAAWGAHRQAVEDAIWAGNNAAMDYLAEKAGYSRVGHHGGAAGRFVDAHDWVIASFFQHTSRSNDPQLHIHNAILNRVQGTDGVWRTLDGHALFRHRGVAAAVGERATEEHLARSLGIWVATRPDGKSREIVGIREQVLNLFSSRRRAITKATAELVRAFEARYGREPNPLELDRLQHQATLATRPRKSHDGETTEQRLDRMEAQLRAEIDTGLLQVATDVLNLAGKAPEPERWSPRAVIEAALADVQQTKAAWTAADLTRAISNALPDRLGDLDGAQIAELLDTLTAEGLRLATPLIPDRPGTDALPDELRLADGRSAYDAPGAKLFATPEHVHSERMLAAGTTRRGAPTLTADAVTEFLTRLSSAGVELGADQAAAVRGVLTSGASVESLVGPAGTGKSFVVSVLNHAWTDPTLWDGQQRKVVGLAASQIATNVLAEEGLPARNIIRWLHVQQRLAEGSSHPDHLAWRLDPGDLVVVDESAMANLADLAAIHRITEEAEAKLLLTGDHRQLAAIGAAGGMQLAAEAGHAYELTDARRFQHEWERAASLRLRNGDETVLGEYFKHGRVIDGESIEHTQQLAANAWLADTLAGKHSLLIVDTHEQAARLSAHLRAELVRLGRVEEDGVPLGQQQTVAGVGDLVQARLNGWHLAGYEGNRRGPINRDTYRVLATREDGGLVVAPVLGHDAAGDVLGEHLTLPGSYVAEHVALGYASTVHAAQGRTVDTAHSVTTHRTGHAALYVALTRGRDRNTTYVATRLVPDDAPTGTANQVRHHDPRTLLAAAFETADPEQSALATAVEAETDNRSIRTAAELFADAAELATAGRTSSWLDQLTADGILTPAQRSELAAEDGAANLNRLLRRAELAGHDPKSVLTDAITSRPLDDARQISNVIHHRISENVSLDPVGDRYADWVPTVDNRAYQTYLHKLARAADRRRDELGAQVVEQQPQWAIEAFGPVPTDEAERRLWRERAGAVAAHRELTGHDDDTAALGAAPKAGQVETYASWRAAWRALDRPDADRDEAEMSDGQLQLRICAYEREKAWAPRYVANELAGTRQAADRHRQKAVTCAAEAADATDTAGRAQLGQEATDAAALADLLDARVGELEAVDEARALWWAHTAGTRAAADRAAAELQARRAADGRTDREVTADEILTESRSATRSDEVDTEIDHRVAVADHPARGRDNTQERDDAERRDNVRGREADRYQVDSIEHTKATDRDTADERDREVSPLASATRPDAADDWDAVHRRAEASEDEHREIRDEADLADIELQREADRRAASPRPHPDAAETAVEDIRATAARERQPGSEDQVRVPTSAETTDSVRRAQRALAEMRARDAADRKREADEARRDRLVHWHQEDRYEQARGAERDQALTRGGFDN